MTIQEIKVIFLQESPNADPNKVDEIITEATARMAEAFRQDRNRLFKVIDAMRFQPRYADKLGLTWRQ